MNTYTAKCDICGTENTVASYGDWACSQCGQGYVYDEGHQIRLTDSQWALLRNPPCRWGVLVPQGQGTAAAATTCTACTACPMQPPARDEVK